MRKPADPLVFYTDLVDLVREKAGPFLGDASDDEVRIIAEDFIYSLVFVTLPEMNCEENWTSRLRRAREKMTPHTER